MKKKFLLAIVMVLVVILACGLVACNKNKNKGNDKPNTPDTPTACEHVYGEWTIDTAATCTTNGAKHKTCTKCGDRVDEVITATGHVFDQEVVDAKYLASEATYTDKAKYYKSCACGEKGTATFETGAALGHNLDAITGVCSRCSSDLGRTITWEDQIFGCGYINFAPVGNKLYLNFTTIKECTFCFDLEAQQYFEDGITEDDFDKNLVKEVKLYKDGDFENEIALKDNNCIGDYYFWWSSVDALDANTKYYLVLTLDQEYEEFVLYFWNIIKEYDELMNLNITTTAKYKFYDGNPFVVEATADEGEVRVIYFDNAGDYGTGTLTPPTEPGNYRAAIYAETETKYVVADDPYFFSIIESQKTISVGEKYDLYYNVPVGTEIQTKVEVEGGKEYVLYVGEFEWKYEVSDDTSTYEIVFDGKQYYLFTAKKDGFITITGTKVNEVYHPYYVGVFDIIEIEDVTVDNIVTLAPSGSQIFKVSTEDAPYLNFNLYDIFDEELGDKFYINCFDPDMYNVDNGDAFDENFVIFPNLTYDYYYIEVDSCNEKETQQFNFKSLPIVADELTIGTPYIDNTKDDAVYGTWFITKAYLEKDKTYIINTFGFSTGIFAENMQFIDNFEDIKEYTPEKDGWIYLFSYKLLDENYPFMASIEEPVV